MNREQETFARLWDQIENDLGYNDSDMSRTRPYCGQPHTDTGQRGATEIKGVTFRDLRDCFIRALLTCSDNAALRDESLKGDAACLCENDMFAIDLNEIDPAAVSQALSCEVEKIMGIYPNVPRLKSLLDPE